VVALPKSKPHQVLNPPQDKLTFHTGLLNLTSMVWGRQNPLGCQFLTVTLILLIIEESQGTEGEKELLKSLCP
jgi:hypothetical protein